jgi:LPS-assembly protein
MKNKFAILMLMIIFANAMQTHAADFELPKPDKDDFIYFTADEVTYDQQSAIAELKGNVEIFLNDKTSKKLIKGSDVQIYTNERILISNGTTTIEDESGSLVAQDVHFDLATRRLIMQEAKADYSPIRVLSDKSLEVKNGAYTLRKATLTCCDREKPHYTIYAGKAYIKPEERIYAVNAVIKIGKIPVFYMPFIYRSLNPNHLFVTYIDFDQSSNTGFGFLTSTVLSVNKFRAAANLDYYTKSGFGYGAEVSYRDPKKFRGSLQAYMINDDNYDGKNKNRWGVNGRYWWQVHDSSNSLNNNNGGAMYFSQLEARSVSDADFNDDFFRANPYAVSPDQVVRSSIVRQSRLNTLRLSYSSQRRLNLQKDIFYNIEETLPKLELIFNPFAVKELGGIVNNVSLSLNNTRKREGDFVQYMEGKWVVSKDLKPHRNFTFTPSVWHNQQIILKDPTNNNEDEFVARYGGQLNLRSDLITGLLDVGYRYQKRSASGSFAANSDPYDNGEESKESNKIYIQNYYIPLPNLYFKLGSGYDLSNSQDDWSLKTRTEPLTAEAGYFSPYSGSNFFVRNIYDINNANQAFIANGTLKVKSGSLLNFGAANYSNARDTFLFMSRILFVPKNSTWRIDTGVDFSAQKSALHAYSKYVNVYKDFHDISLMLGVRDRNQNLSFSIRINILCGKPAKGSKGDSAADNYWYPWRADEIM